MRSDHAVVLLLLLMRVTSCTGTVVVRVRSSLITSNTTQSFRMAIDANIASHVLADRVAARLNVPAASLTIASDGHSQAQPPFHNGQLILAALVANTGKLQEMAWASNTRGVAAYLASSKMPRCSYRTLKLESHQLEGKKNKCLCETPVCGFTTAVQSFKQALLLGANGSWIFHHNLGIALQAEHTWCSATARMCFSDSVRDRSGAASGSVKYQQLSTIFASSVAGGSYCPGTFLELGEAFKFSGNPAAALEPYRMLHSMLRGVDSPKQQARIAKLDCYSDGRVLEMNTLPQQVFDRRGNYISLHKLAHDVEQLQYLHGKYASNTAVGAALYELESLNAATRSILTRNGIAHINQPGSDREMALQEPWVSRLSPHTDRALHMASAPALPGAAVAPCSKKKRTALEHEYHETGVVYTDNFLTEGALSSLLAFCQDSTIWYDMKNGYLGAYWHDGFGNELLMQVERELRALLPTVFANHSLVQLWSYKYHSELQKGINMHADSAAVNVNFWVTPDEAHLNKDGGGLVIHNVHAPEEWSFQEFNTDQTLIEGFLAEHPNQRVKIPYRQNRAVIFNSDFFHTTDEFRFKKGYKNRRINITMLFGIRGKPR